MTTFYAAAKYPLHTSEAEQFTALSDLTMVAVELVRLARTLDRTLDEVTSVFEEASSQAEWEWAETAGDA